MQVNWVVMYQIAVLLPLLQGCLSATGGWRELKNDATELIPGHTEHTEHSNHHQQFHNNNNTMNEAKNGGRRQEATSPSYDAADLSCRELRSNRYITDGACRSTKPVKEMICSGQCLPAQQLPNSILRSKWWRNNNSYYRCIPAHYRALRIQLQCPEGKNRNFKIHVVTSCKCKRFGRYHNQSDAKIVTSQKTRRNKKPARLHQGQIRNREPALSSNSY